MGDKQDRECNDTKSLQSFHTENTCTAKTLSECLNKPYNYYNMRTHAPWPPDPQKVKRYFDPDAAETDDSETNLSPF